MKINPSYRPTPDAGEARPAGSSAARPAQPAAPAGGASAQVELSSASAALQSPDGDVNLERVQALRDAIRHGQLSYDAGKIADGLLDSARELLRGDASNRG